MQLGPAQVASQTQEPCTHSPARLHSIAVVHEDVDRVATTSGATRRSTAVRANRRSTIFSFVVGRRHSCSDRPAAVRSVSNDIRAPGRAAGGAHFCLAGPAVNLEHALLHLHGAAPYLLKHFDQLCLPTCMRGSSISRGSDCGLFPSIYFPLSHCVAVSFSCAAAKRMRQVSRSLEFHLRSQRDQDQWRSICSFLCVEGSTGRQSMSRVRAGGGGALLKRISATLPTLPNNYRAGMSSAARA